MSQVQEDPLINVTIDQLKAMGDEGAQEIRRRYQEVFPDGTIDSLSCMAAALEIFQHLASTHLITKGVSYLATQSWEDGVFSFEGTRNYYRQAMNLAEHMYVNLSPKPEHEELFPSYNAERPPLPTDLHNYLPNEKQGQGPIFSLANIIIEEEGVHQGYAHPTPTGISVNELRTIGRGEQQTCDRYLMLSERYEKVTEEEQEDLYLHINDRELEREQREVKQKLALFVENNPLYHPNQADTKIFKKCDRYLGLYLRIVTELDDSMHPDGISNYWREEAGVHLSRPRPFTPDRFIEVRNRSYNFNQSPIIAKLERLRNDPTRPMFVFQTLHDIYFSDELSYLRENERLAPFSVQEYLNTFQKFQIARIGQSLFVQNDSDIVDDRKALIEEGRDLYLAETADDERLRFQYKLLEFGVEKVFRATDDESLLDFVTTFYTENNHVNTDIFLNRRNGRLFNRPSVRADLTQSRAPIRRLDFGDEQPSISIEDFDQIPEDFVQLSEDELDQYQQQEEEYRAQKAKTDGTLVTLEEYNCAIGRRPPVDPDHDILNKIITRAEHLCIEEKAISMDRADLFNNWTRFDPQTILVRLDESDLSDSSKLFRILVKHYQKSTDTKKIQFNVGSAIDVGGVSRTVFGSVGQYVKENLMIKTGDRYTIGTKKNSGKYIAQFFNLALINHVVIGIPLNIGLGYCIVEGIRDLNPNKFDLPTLIGLLSLQDSDKLQSLLNHELWLEDGEYGRQSLADQDYVVGRLGVEERPLDMEDRFEWIRRACFVEMFGNRKNPELFAFLSEINLNLINAYEKPQNPLLVSKDYRSRKEGIGRASIHHLDPVFGELFDYDKVITAIRFVDVPPSTEDFFKTYLQDGGKEKLRAFLTFTVGNTDLSSPITVYQYDRDSLPVSHTCSRELEINRMYGDYETFKNDFDEALATTGFGFA